MSYSFRRFKYEIDWNNKHKISLSHADLQIYLFTRITYSGYARVIKEQ